MAIKKTPPKALGDITLLEANSFWKQRPLPAKTILLAEGLTPGKLLRLAYNTRVGNIVQREVMNLEREVNASHVLIRSPDEVLANPAKVILKQNYKTAFNQKFTSSDEKQIFLTNLRASVFEIPHARATVDPVATIADELFTNALYNAPTGHGGSRKAAVELDASQSAELFVEHDDENLLIGCRDRFGSLVLEAVLFNLYDIYQRGIASSIRPGTGGAGIGFRMMFGLCVSTYIVVDPGKQTFVGFVLPLGAGAKRRQSPLKNIHFSRIGSPLMNELKIVRGSSNDREILQFFGAINEESKLEKIIPPAGDQLLLDLGGVTSINSCGTRDFLNWIKEIQKQKHIVYMRCPRSIIDQFSIVGGLLNEKTSIESLYLPYFCTHCEEGSAVLLESKEFPVDNRHAVPSANKCPNCDQDTELDVIESEYFRFLAR